MIWLTEIATCIVASSPDWSLTTISAPTSLHCAVLFWTVHVAYATVFPEDDVTAYSDASAESSCRV